LDVALGWEEVHVVCPLFVDWRAEAAKFYGGEEVYLAVLQLLVQEVLCTYILAALFHLVLCVLHPLGIDGPRLFVEPVVEISLRVVPPRLLLLLCQIVAEDLWQFELGP
jgi:hypothetical protein